jgi:hypothetical protein
MEPFGKVYQALDYEKLEKCLEKNGYELINKENSKTIKHKGKNRTLGQIFFPEKIIVTYYGKDLDKEENSITRLNAQKLEKILESFEKELE